MDAGSAGHAASLLADGVQLVEDDDVQARVGAHLGKGTDRTGQMGRRGVWDGPDA